jgi:hypothetical protein
MMLTNFQLQAAGDIPAKGNEKGKAVSALPFAAGCHEECLGWGIGGAKLKLKNGRHGIFVFLLQTLTRFFQLLFLGSELNRTLGLKLLNEMLHL